MTNQISIYGSYINTLGVYLVRSGAVITMARLVEPDQSNFFFDTYPDLSPASLEALPEGFYWDVHYPTEADPHCWISYRVQTQARTVAYILVEFNLDRFIADSTAQDVLVSSAMGLGACTVVAFGRKNRTMLPFMEKAAAGKSFELNGVSYTASIQQTRLDGNHVLVASPITRLKQIEYTFALVIVITSAIVVFCIVVLSSNLNTHLFTPVEKLMDAAQRGGTMPSRRST